MGFFGSFTGSDQRRDQRQGYAESSDILAKGYSKAQSNLTSGYRTADRFYGQARGDVTTGYNTAKNALSQGVGKAVAQYQPYADSGASANTLYGNALGLNGGAQQQQFMANYQADPFRDSNAQFATNALMQSLNARGLSGSGTAAAAVAQENLRRGSEDYNNYLNRLQGVSSQGQQAAGNIASLYANQGQQMAQYGMQYGSDLANITGQRAALASGYGDKSAALNSDLAATQAGNRINLANSLANSRGIFANNLIGLLGTASKAAEAYATKGKGG